MDPALAYFNRNLLSIFLPIKVPNDSLGI